MKNLHEYAKKSGESLFLLTVYALSKAINLVPEFRLRLLSDKRVIEFDRIATLTPILLEDNECYLVRLEYFDRFADYKRAAKPIVDNAKKGIACPAAYDDTKEDIICASFLPWFSFISMIHAKMKFKERTYPVLSWGKMNDAYKINLAIQFDHSFIDGYHIGLFVKAMEDALNNPEKL